MCGRFVAASPPDQIARYFDADAPEAALEPSYNVAPTNDVYAVLEDGSTRRVEALHWGLVPRWAKDLSIGNRMINARAETLAEKNAYKSAFAKRRCIIPADGFYEWRVEPGQKKKQPYFIHRSDGEPLAFAGLWEVWKNPNSSDAEEVHSCTIITGEANEKIRDVHDRMPVILPPKAWDTWLDPQEHDLDVLGRLLVPAPASLLDLHPVSTEVNTVRNKGPQLVHRVEPTNHGPAGEGQGTLL
jgi:putative SOS response-associated peptidase YedK